MSVTLREKPIKQGKEKSLYLDYYPPIRNPRTGVLTRREFLGIYIVANPKTKPEKSLNDEKLAKANGIRGLREMDIINERFDFIDKDKNKQDFLKYIDEFSKKSGSKNYKFVYKHFYNFMNGVCTIADMTPEIANGYREYLLTTKSIRNKIKPKLNINSALSYFDGFRAILNQAYKDKVLTYNVNDFVDHGHKEETQREFLTTEEVIKLYETPCEDDVLKRACLFSCLTGIRYSDIEKLVWSEIQLTDTNEPFIRFRQKKTGGLERMPISIEALELCGNSGESTDKVFKDLIYSNTQTYMKVWLVLAGITRHITFHCFRHTYATLQLEADTDIYTVSKMLGHRELKTTQIYAHLLDKKKRDTTTKISLKRTKNINS